MAAGFCLAGAEGAHDAGTSMETALLFCMSRNPLGFPIGGLSVICSIMIAGPNTYSFFGSFDIRSSRSCISFI